MTPMSHCAAGAHFSLMPCGLWPSYSSALFWPQPGTQAEWAVSIWSSNRENREHSHHTWALTSFFLEVTHVTSVHASLAKTKSHVLPKFIGWAWRVFYARGTGWWTVLLWTTGAGAVSHCALCAFRVYLPKPLFLVASHRSRFVWESCGLSWVSREELKEPRGWLHLHLVQKGRLGEEAYIQNQKILAGGSFGEVEKWILSSVSFLMLLGWELSQDTEAHSPDPWEIIVGSQY